MGAERPSRQGVLQSVEAIREAIPKFRTRWWQKQVDLVDALTYDKKNPLRINYPVLRGVLRDMGHNPKDMIEAWKQSSVDVALTIDTDPDAWADMCLENFYAMINLEAAQPGSTALLSKQFGIRAFGRYPQQLLEEQAAQVDDTEYPYGVVIYPRSDYNGAYYESASCVEDVWRGLHSTHWVRAIEVSGDQDIIRRLQQLHARYGPDNDGHKIAFAIIGGHGHDYCMHFGDRAGGRIYTEDIARHRRLRALGNFFEPGAPVVFNACYAGVPKGMAETIAKTCGVNTIASSAEVNLASLKVRIQQGRPVFDVKYKDGKQTKATRIFGG